MESPVEISDQELMSKIQEQDTEALAILISRHSYRYYATAYRILANGADAEDVVQESFVKLWTKPDRWDPHRGASFTTWFHQVVVYQSLDLLRKRKKIEEFDFEEMEDETSNLNQEYLKNERESNLWEIVKKLPDRQRTAIVLCYSEGYSNKEAAQLMNVQLKAFESLLVRAKTTLRTWHQNQTTSL